MATLGDLWGLGLIFGTLGCTFLLLLLKQVMNLVEAMKSVEAKLGEPVEAEVHHFGCGCDVARCGDEDDDDEDDDDEDDDDEDDDDEDDDDEDDEGEEWKRGGE